MAKVYRTRFTVEGRGHFPVDMLRYDCCYPETSRDGKYIQVRHEDITTILLARVHAGKQWHPTEARWNSFRWAVVDIDKPEELK